MKKKDLHLAVVKLLAALLNKIGKLEAEHYRLVKEYNRRVKRMVSQIGKKR